MDRGSTVAGRFYPGDPAVLRKEIETFFMSETEKKPEVTRAEGKIGILCPHAGYVFSGRTASYGYRALAERFPEHIIILGPNHRGVGAPVAVMTEGKWETPMGSVTIDMELAEAILEECEILRVDERAHRDEHSIEVQLPFLQYLSSEMTFVPISMAAQDIETARKVGSALKKVIEDESVGIIASSDLMHYGYMYGYVPFRENILEQMRERDHSMLRAIVSLDPGKIYEYMKTGYTMCGYGCVSTMIYALEEHVEKGTVLHYSTSYEVSHDTGAVVGYGAAVLR